MVVSVDRSDRPWQTHLNGLLVILRQSRDLVNGKRLFVLMKALQLMNSKNLGEAMSALQVCRAEKAGILLNVAKLRLRRLNSELNKLFAGTASPRKLDIQRL
jgi:hypothetical protein